MLGIGMEERLSKRTNSRAKRIFVVEDHPVFREGLREMINQAKGLAVCGEAATYSSALKEIRRLEPDLALIDITLTDGSGLELIRKLRTLNLKTKLLVVSMHDEALFANRALLAGGDGYVMKQEDPEEILHAIHDVLRGHTYLSEEILNPDGKAATRRFQPKDPRLDQLTDQELEILEWLGLGKSNLEISRIIHSPGKIVAESRTRIREKLGLKTDHELIRYAAGWVKTEDR